MIKYDYEHRMLQIQFQEVFSPLETDLQGMQLLL